MLGLYFNSGAVFDWVTSSAVSMCEVELWTCPPGHACPLGSQVRDRRSVACVPSPSMLCC
jgi:hypothetical protein